MQAGFIDVETLFSLSLSLSLSPSLPLGGIGNTSYIPVVLFDCWMTYDNVIPAYPNYPWAEYHIIGSKAHAMLLVRTPLRRLEASILISFVLLGHEPSHLLQLVARPDRALMPSTLETGVDSMAN